MTLQSFSLSELKTIKDHLWTDYQRMLVAKDQAEADRLHEKILSVDHEIKRRISNIDYAPTETNG